MSTQRMFAGLAWSQKGKVTRRERFLAEMDAVIPWARLVKLIALTTRKHAIATPRRSSPRPRHFVQILH